MARCFPWTRTSGSTATTSTPSRWWWTVWCAREGMEERLTQSIETALGLAEGKAMVDVIDGPTLTFSQHLACDLCGLSFSELAPRNFSFNSPYGACPTCAGIGARYQVAEDLVVPNDRLSITEGAIAPWAYQYSGYYARLLNALSEDIGFSLETPWRELPQAVREEILQGNFRPQAPGQLSQPPGPPPSLDHPLRGGDPPPGAAAPRHRVRLRPGLLPASTCGRSPVTTVEAPGWERSPGR